MAISQAVCNVFKQELLKGNHDFDGGTTYYIALYTSSANLGATTTAFTTTGQASGTNYTSGGNNLTRVDPTSSGTTGFTDFADLTFSSVTLSAVGALIYKSGGSNPAVLVLDFGGNKTATNGDFIIQFPTADASNAIIRLGDA